MKAKSKVPKAKVEAQLNALEEELVKVNQFLDELPKTVEELRQLDCQLGDTLGGTVLLSEMLIQHGDDKLEVKNEAGEKIVYSSVGMASGEILELYVSKLYAVYNELDRIHSKMSRWSNALAPKKSQGDPHSAAPQLT